MLGLLVGSGARRRVVLMLGLALSLLAGTGVALPGVATAGVAKVIEVTIPPEEEGGDPDVEPAPSYTAAAGEANRVLVTQVVAPGMGLTPRVLIEDLGAVVTVGAGCTLVDAHHARCDYESNLSAVIALGDLADTLTTATGASVDANGGPGIDHLTGANFGDTLDGGGGAADVLAGGAGDDTLSDGDGSGGAPFDADTLDGGPGRDTVSYANRVTPVGVALPATLVAGQTGEGDHLTAIENATGGKGADKLTGDAGRNALAGGPGADVIVAGAGADAVDGGAGGDAIKAGAGNDVVVGGKGKDRIDLGSGNDVVDDSDLRPPTGVDTISCGTGRDKIIATQDREADKLIRDCELFVATEKAVDGNEVFDVGAIGASPLELRRHGSLLTLPVRCMRSTGLHLPACVISGELRSPDGRRTLARAIRRVKIKPGHHGVLRFRLTAAGLRQVHSGLNSRLVLAERTRKGIELLKHARAETTISLPCPCSIGAG